MTTTPYIKFTPAKVSSAKKNPLHFLAYNHCCFSALYFVFVFF